MTSKMPWTLAFALVAVGVYLILGPVPETLILDRSIPLRAESWRAFSAHLAHSDPAHLLLDVAGLLLVGWLYEPVLRGRMTALLLLGMPSIVGAVMLLEPGLAAYCGLSGIVNLIVGAGLAATWRAESRDPLAILFALAVAAKILLECLTGEAVFSDTAWSPVHSAHAAGFLIGIVLETARPAKIAGIVNPQEDTSMTSSSGPRHAKTGKPINSTKLDRVVADARKASDERAAGYREQALKLYDWVCGRCARTFTRENLRELTVHHKDMNHDNNPPDGSNWELLCVYCHDNEHQKYEEHLASLAGGRVSKPGVAGKQTTHNPFEGLADLLKKDG
ncbi:rhomboid family GlyGly-CTERM serine protease [Thiocapsa roseopersicina]|uniref:Putative HNH nuclease YajD n=2 Tax=Thiocapsa roseopersicina TaxID=1058 RepID=A0A1H2T4U2_THIRO|nr:rhomboid family GlyGly-CTERM serine protease [Thiocapsa roseopersicina]